MSIKVNNIVLWNGRTGTVIDVDIVDGRAMVQFNDGEDLSNDDLSYPSSMQYIPLDELTLKARQPMTTKAQAYNRAIAEALGYTFEYIDYSMSRQVVRSPQGELVRISDYYHDLNAAITAAGELLPGRWQLIHFNSGFRFDWSGSTDKWYDIHPQSNEPQAIAAAICEAIVQARGLVSDATKSKGR